MKPFTAIARSIEGHWATPGVRHLVKMYYKLKAWELAARHRFGARDRGLTAQRFCEKPFEHFETTETGNVYVCCSFWVPAAIGDLNTQGAREIWNSERAQDIRRSILDGSFKYCDAELCSKIQAKTLPTVAEARKNPAYRRIIDQKITRLDTDPSFFNMSHDRSCNLSCPSCRTGKIAFSAGAAYERRKRIHDKVVGAFLTHPTDRALTLHVTGSGDPIGSRIFREFLQGLDGAKFPNMKLWLQTNGVLFTPKSWSRIGRIQGNIEYLYVSIDAATEATYNVTRRGGNWRLLLRNMEQLAPACRERGINLQFHFVVQLANFREMPEFVKLGRNLRVQSVYFTKVVNWGTWTVEEFDRVSVWRPEHPQYDELLRILALPEFDEPFVSLGNLSQAHAIARRRYGAAPARAAVSRQPERVS